MKSIKQTVYALTIVLLLPASFAAGATSDKTSTRKEAVQLIKQVEAASRKIHSESAHLQAMQRNPLLSNRSHNYKLQVIATQVNHELRPALLRLDELQPHLPQWKQQAINQMRISAATLASSANAAILNRNEAGSRRPSVLDPEYGRLIQNITNHAENLMQVADASADYGKAQLKGADAGLSIASHD